MVEAPGGQDQYRGLAIPISHHVRAHMKLSLAIAAFFLVLLFACNMGEVAMPESGDVVQPIPMDAGEEKE